MFFTLQNQYCRILVILLHVDLMQSVGMVSVHVYLNITEIHTLDVVLNAQ